MPGCKDPDCCCAVCALPIGVAEDDPRWLLHREDCVGCEVCIDQVPFMLFRGAGVCAEMAVFHERCFQAILKI
jgi:hypothetical protein